MRQKARSWVFFALRWGIAVAGIWWVLWQMSFRDTALILDENDRPVRAVVLAPAAEDSGSFRVLDPATHRPEDVPAERVVNPPEKAGGSIQIVTTEGRRRTELLALDLDPKDLTRVRHLWVAGASGARGERIEPHQVVGEYRVKVPRPRVEVGVVSLISMAKPWLLWLAILVFPVTFIITSYRWHLLLLAQDIRITLARTFVLNMVGFFYSTFMLGSTGGDLIKAYYASKQTPHRHRAVISVIVDRVIGLLALIVLAGAMAAYQYLVSPDPTSAAAQVCLRVAAGSAVALAATMLFLVVMGHSDLRRRVGLDYVLQKLPMQRHLEHVLQAMRLYRQRPGLILWSLIATLPVHITVVISAMLAGSAFGLPLPRGYYFVAVPTIVLAGAIPISPQGAGVMEFFAVHLTRQYGATVSQAFALTMSIRLVQMLWNLTGGIFVFLGGYHPPSQKEQDGNGHDGR